MKCANGCGNDAPTGFSTCSTDCNAADQRRVFIPKGPPADILPGDDLINGEMLAAELGVSPACVYQWGQAGKIPYQRLSERRIRYSRTAVKAALADRSERQLRTPPPSDAPPAPAPTAENALGPVEVVPEYATSREGNEAVLTALKTVRRSARDRVLEVVRQVTADLMLEEADRLESSGDVVGAYAVLRDYIVIDGKLARVFQ